MNLNIAYIPHSMPGRRRSNIMAPWEDYLRSIYYDVKHAGSLAGPQKLHHVVVKEGKFNIGLYKIRKWLQNQEPYSMQRALQRKFKRNRVIATGIDDQWDADLIDMSKYAKYNDKVHFILLVIDVFSKHVWLRPLLNKTGQGVAKAFKDILSEGRKASRTRTDKGQEFRARPVQQLFKDEGIHHFVTHNEPKANIAERAVKSLKTKIQRFINYKQSFRYIDNLQNFAKSYNSTYHRSIGMEPDNVTKDNETDVWWNLYWPEKEHHKKLSMKKVKPFKFKIGDLVRLSHLRHAFSREYDQKWTGELFKITRRYRRGGSHIYKVKDFNNKDIEGSFYPHELQRVTVKEDQLWKVDKILKTRKRNGQTEHLIRWLYWPKDHDSWVNANDIVDI